MLWLARFIGLYYVCINLILFVLMGVDKRKAVKRRFRVPEKTLLLSACLGGGVGGLLGMNLFRHKNRKWVFWVIYILSIAVHTILLGYAYIHWMTA